MPRRTPTLATLQPSPPVTRGKQPKMTLRSRPKSNARLKPPARRTAVQTPTVSLIIVTYDRYELLASCLDSIFALVYPAKRLDVIVVDNGATRGLGKAMRRRFPQLRWFTNDTNNYCRANNLGIAHSQGSVIGFLNDDVRVDRR